MNNTPFTQQLTDSFNPSVLVNIFIQFAPYILGVASVILAVALIRWGLRAVLQHTSYWGGSISGTLNNYRYDHGRRFDFDDEAEAEFQAQAEYNRRISKIRDTTSEDGRKDYWS